MRNNYVKRRAAVMRMSLYVSLFAFYMLFIAMASAYAEIPKLIQYQGKATEKASGLPLTGNHNVTFRLYDSATTGTLQWQEQHLNVPVSNGNFAVLLGSQTALNLPFDKPYWLSVEINNDGEMSPRERLASVPYAYTAQTAQYAVTVQQYLIANYITGCELEYVDGSNIRVAPGSVELDGDLLTRSTYSPTVDLAAPGNWLHGSESPNMWVYVYLSKDSSSWTVGLSDESPNSHDTSGNIEGILRYRSYVSEWHRCIGAVRNDGSGNIRRFFQRGAIVMYDVPVNITTSLSSGSWSAATSCAAAMPAISTMALFGLRVAGEELGGIWIRPNGSTWSTDFGNGIFVDAGPYSVGIGGQRICATDSSQRIQYQTLGGNPISIDVEGYYLDIR